MIGASLIRSVQVRGRTNSIKVGATRENALSQ